jgi:hypothetical protein
MTSFTTPTQQALARIATAPATSEQGRTVKESLTVAPAPLPTRLALAACPMPSRCPVPCEMCAEVAERVVAEYLR